MISQVHYRLPQLEDGLREYMWYNAISCNNKLTLMQAGEKLRTAYVRGGLASLSLMLTSAFVVVRRCLMC